jgi:hypothetical protein
MLSCMADSNGAPSCAYLIRDKPAYLIRDKPAV